MLRHEVKESDKMAWLGFITFLMIYWCIFMAAVTISGGTNPDLPHFLYRKNSRAVSSGGRPCYFCISCSMLSSAAGASEPIEGWQDGYDIFFASMEALEKEAL